MAVPGIPQNVNLQQGNGNAFLSWNLVAGATGYSVNRSTDGVSFSVIATPATNLYLDTTAVVGTNYFYQVASVNGSGTSSYSSAQSIIPTLTSDVSLGQLRLMAQQRADRVNSNFVTLPEWNSYINQSAFELYDLLIDVYEDYYVTGPTDLTTDGTNMVPLPSDFYKLMGVDGSPGSSNCFVTLKKFNFIARNRYIYPQLPNTLLGIFNPQYRLVGSNLMLIPTPQAGQTVRIWYIPKMVQLLQDTDILQGVSGWSEYIICDAAIKALQKEESDVSILGMQKMALIKRIEDSAMNRDAGQPDTISDTRSFSDRWGGMGGLGWDGPYGGM